MKPKPNNSKPKKPKEKEGKGQEDPFLKYTPKNPSFYMVIGLPKGGGVEGISEK